MGTSTLEQVTRAAILITLKGSPHLEPYLTFSEIKTKFFGNHQQSNTASEFIDYHLQHLINKGLVYSANNGKEKRYYLTEMGDLFATTVLLASEEKVTKTAKVENHNHKIENGTI
ncbi:MAG: hypothetical protein AABX59_02370 [Nanoarchaeota archaeon]